MVAKYSVNKALFWSASLHPELKFLSSLIMTFTLDLFIFADQQLSNLQTAIDELRGRWVLHKLVTSLRASRAEMMPSRIYHPKLRHVRSKIPPTSVY